MRQPEQTAFNVKPLRYHLRFQILPGRNVERDAGTLADFCKQHGIEEAVLFYAAEEWNKGLLSQKEEDRWFDTLERAKKVLDKAEIVSSVNPWPTTLHCSHGRTMPEDRDFAPMVSPSGEISKACASFADPAWREYLWRQYGRFAKLGFRVMWVEDDFRYHNHRPLTWGGGFEPPMLERFGRKIGRKVSREEVVRAVLKPGKPHPWRSKWFATWGEAQTEVAAGLAEAVARNAPGETRLGLMSSLPAAHSKEGRNWRELFDALTIDGRVAHRPNFFGSGDGLGLTLDRSMMMLDLQRTLRPPGCEVAPELESYPFTRWGRSDTMNWAQMALCMFFGADALLLDLFPFSGNPADREPQIGELLDRSRPALEWICQRFSKDLRTSGVGIPWREDAQAHVRLRRGESLDELQASSFGPGHLLLRFGVPVSADRQAVNAVFGSLAWAFDDNDIRDMLSGGLILDAESAEILCERGFGPHIGAQFDGWLDREESPYSIEMVEDGDDQVPEGHYMNAYRLPRMGVLKPSRNTRAWTVFMTPERRRVGAGIVAYENRLGGRVVVYGAPDPGQNLTPSYQRQALAQRAVRFAAGGRFVSPITTASAYLMPVHFRKRDGGSLVVLNGAADPARPEIQMPDGFNRRLSAALLTPLAEPAKAKVRLTRRDGKTVVRCQTDVPHLGYLVLQW